MAAREGSRPGTLMYTSSPRSRLRSTVSHSRIIGSALPDSSSAPTAASSAAAGWLSARSRVSSRGNRGRNPSSGQVCSTPVTACNTHRPSTVVVSMPLSPQYAEGGAHARPARICPTSELTASGHVRCPPGRPDLEQTADVVVGVDRVAEHLSGRLTVLVHRFDEATQSREHLGLSIEEPHRAFSGEELL